MKKYILGVLLILAGFGNAYAVDFQAENLVVIGTTTFQGNVVYSTVAADLFIGDLTGNASSSTYSNS